MADKPTPPTGDYELREVIYAQDGIIDVMTDNEIAQGRNMTGEIETPLGSVPNAHKDNFWYNYLNQHIVYIEKMLDYLVEKVEGEVV